MLYKYTVHTIGEPDKKEEGIYGKDALDEKLHFTKFFPDFEKITILYGNELIIIEQDFFLITN